MVVAHTTVDIPRLKARHPLGDTVEAIGVHLRGKGRVRQGVCPFHDEAEGSFTVYGDSERFYCFGCGAGGDVLDFIQRVDCLTLPEAIRRLDGSPGLAPRAATRPARTRRTWDAALPPRDPALLTAAARFYAGQLRHSPEAHVYLASRGIGLDAALRLGLGYAPGRGLREALESAGFNADMLRACGLFMERGGERFAGMVVVPDASGSLVRWLVGRAVDPDRTPGSRRSQAPSRCLGLSVSAPPRPGQSSLKGFLTGSPLPSGAYLQSQPSAPRWWSGSSRPSGAAPASSSPLTPPPRALRPRSGLLACSDAGSPPSRRQRLRSTLPYLFAGLAPASLTHIHYPGGPMPSSRRGLHRTRLPIGKSAPAIRYRNNTTQGALKCSTGTEATTKTATESTRTPL